MEEQIRILTRGNEELDAEVKSLNMIIDILKEDNQAKDAEITTLNDKHIKKYLTKVQQAKLSKLKE